MAEGHARRFRVAPSSKPATPGRKTQPVALLEPRRPCHRSVARSGRAELPSCARTCAGFSRSAANLTGAALFRRSGRATSAPLRRGGHASASTRPAGRHRAEDAGPPSPGPQHDHLDHRTTMPARIVTSTYRYKRPPRKRKPVLLEVPAIVTKRAPRPQASAPKPPAPANDDRKPAIVTVKRRRSRFGDVPDMTPEEKRGRPTAVF